MTLDEESIQDYHHFEPLRHSDSSTNVALHPVKPPMLHTGSTPNFTQVHNFTAPKKLDEHITQAANSNTAPDEYDLLEWIAKKLSDEYRYKKFNIPEQRDPKTITKANYEKRVSFDTIDIDYCDDFEDDDDSGNYHVSSANTNFDDQLANSLNSYASSLNPNDARGTGRGRSPVMSPNSRSPIASPSRRVVSSVSPSRESGPDFSREIARLLKQKRIDYPTTPIITHRGCTFSKLHRQFENLYLGKLDNEANGNLKPVLPKRCILVYISGRKHTWVALDWVLHHFIEHGDTVIIVSAIHSRQLAKTANNTRRRSSAYAKQVTPMTPRMRLRQRNQPAFVKVIAKNIMSYVMEVINPSIIARVSVELAVGKTKDVMKEMYKLYEPNLVCTGTKPNSRISAPLKSWLSSKLTDRLVKNFPLPVIVVPAMNINKMEDQLERDINQRFHTETESDQAPASPLDQFVGQSHSANTDDDDRLSINSSESESSVLSEESYSSYDEISKLYVNYKKDLRQNIKTLAKEEVNDQYFANFAKLVSDKSSALCRDIRGVDPDFRGKGSKLARAITGSNSFGVVPYKTKSLLAPVEKPVKKESSPLGPSMSYKEMKQNLLRNSVSPTHSSSQPQVPPLQINFQGPSPEPSPVDGNRKTSLKFVNLETPLANKNKNDSKMLHKSLSYEPDSSSRPPLEPLKSHPDIMTALANDKDYKAKEKKSKKKKFWKIFS